MKKINGNTTGVKQSTLDRLCALYDMRVEGDSFVSPDMLFLMAETTEATNREVSVYISRDGRVADVSMGDSSTVSMPTMRLTRNTDRLSGVRCIHTHPGGSPVLSSIDIGTLQSALLDSMCAIGVKDGLPGYVSAAFIDGRGDDGPNVKIEGPLPFYAIPHEKWLDEIYEADAKLISQTVEVKEAVSERVVLVGVDTGKVTYDSMAELKALAETTGVKVVASACQARPVPDKVYYVGKGKAEELSRMAAAGGIDLFIFNDELTSPQIRNLEEILGARVIDRTTLILDIFASRATTREGSLQVELAQLKYRLPRLTGQGQSLSRLGGGIGTRGPGEKKLESDRRRIRRRIYELECDLREVEKQRALRRTRREKNSVPTVAIVGYTNAGKSTLLNMISGSDVTAADMLFATLDPVTRRVTMPDGGEVLFTDTVGFIEKLPHDLVEAFKSTLEEAVYADVILHVVDSANAEMTEQMRTVDEVLESIGAGGKPTVTAYNKTDKRAQAMHCGGNSVAISATDGTGIDELLALIQRIVFADSRTVTLTIPYNRGDVTALIQQKGRIYEESYDETGTVLTVSLDRATLGQIGKLLGN